MNKAIHLLCIWPIIWTGYALMTQCSFGKLPDSILEQLPLREEAWNLHLGTPFVMVYIFLYLGECFLLIAVVAAAIVGSLASIFLCGRYLNWFLLTSSKW